MYIAFGVVAAFVGFLLVWGAAAPLTEHRDADGYYMSDFFTVDRPSRAIVTRDMGLLRGRYETVVESSVILAFVAEPDEIRMQGVASGPAALFMGIAATPVVDDYLSGVAHDEISEWEADRANIVDVGFTSQEGTVSPDGPATETFWVASVSGTGPLTLDWTIESGDWTAVIMNADAASGVTAELAFGALPSSGIDALSWVALSVGLVLLVGGGLLVYLGFRHRGGDSASLPAETGELEMGAADGDLPGRPSSS